MGGVERRVVRSPGQRFGVPSSFDDCVATISLAMSRSSDWRWNRHKYLDLYNIWLHIVYMVVSICHGQ